MRTFKIKAFTILEVLINIVIMSIIIGMVYYIYSAFSKQIIMYHSNVVKENKMGGFCLQIKRDFHGAEEIVKTAIGFDVVFYDAKVINYEISGINLIRKQGQSFDSLMISNVKLKSMADTIRGRELIQKITVNSNLFSDNVEYSVSKKYPFALSNVLSDGD